VSSRFITRIFVGVPRRVIVFSAALIGLFIGVGSFTFRYAEGLSYFSSNPKTCVNCHIMRPQFDSWQKSSHHTAAVCVDCHLPRSPVPKLLAKGLDGYLHSKGFTLQDFHEPIRISPLGSKIVENNCIACHGSLFHGKVPRPTSTDDHFRCVHCHSGVGHGEQAGLGGPETEAERQETPK
jgi:cytochrome c nitrite reductase small subunit